jgi:hypothetical protein
VSGNSLNSTSGQHPVDTVPGPVAIIGAGNMGGTTIVVNVAGNEFSAEDFARKVAPELRRQIALTGSY